MPWQSLCAMRQVEDKAWRPWPKKPTVAQAAVTDLTGGRPTRKVRRRISSVAQAQPGAGLQPVFGPSATGSPGGSQSPAVNSVMGGAPGPGCESQLMLRTGHGPCGGWQPLSGILFPHLENRQRGLETHGPSLPLAS